jgi:hypothetical protein
LIVAGLKRVRGHVDGRDVLLPILPEADEAGRRWREWRVLHVERVLIEGAT